MAVDNGLAAPDRPLSKAAPMQTQSEKIRKFIIGAVTAHPNDIAKLTAEQFSITRQAVNRHLKILIEDGIIEAQGNTRERTYRLKVVNTAFEFEISKDSEEDQVWRQHIDSLLSEYDENVQSVCYYGFTEMYNNAVDHSAGNKILVAVTRSARSISLLIQDDEIGVFEKIKSRFQLPDHRAAILQLSKGKLTTDPSRHSGQGIFFTSRIFDQFILTANHLFFNHETEDDDWLIAIDDSVLPGTTVQMTIAADSTRTTKEVFDRYAPRDENDEFPFSKTHVPLSLARYGNEQLVSRSQAKRVLARFERFEEVLLDFSGIDEVGQAFADEIFRVFRRSHPDIKLVTANANPEVLRMIRRAENPANEPSGPDSSTMAD